MQYIYIYIYIYIYTIDIYTIYIYNKHFIAARHLFKILCHKWSTTHRVLKSHRSKMSVIYMQSQS